MNVVTDKPKRRSTAWQSIVTQSWISLKDWRGVFFPQSSELKIATSNYVPGTATLETGVLGLDIETLQKTVNVIDQHIERFSGHADPTGQQYVSHLIIAKRCVEEIMAQKSMEKKRKKNQANAG